VRDGALSDTAKKAARVERPVYMDVDCPKCNVVTTHDVPAREAGRTDYPVSCPNCNASFELWLDPQWFMQ
jgi:phage FluMu protein Com